MKKIKAFMSTLSNKGLVIATLGILILLNYIVSFFPLRLDLTQDQRFSLAPVTKDILNNTDDIVTIKLYISTQLPNQVLPIKQELDSVLAEFERVSSGKIQVQTVVPDAPDKEQEAASLGIPKLQFSGFEREKLQVQQGYFGGVIEYGGKSETIPVFEEGANYEYLLISSIKRLTSNNIPTVAFTTGHGEVEQIAIANQLLSRDFNVTTQVLVVTEGENIAISDNVSTLVVVGSTQVWQEQEKQILRDFVNSGKSVLLAVEGVEVTENLQAFPVDHNLNDTFSALGLSLNSDLVVSASNEIANFRTATNIFLTPYPFWIRIQPAGVNKDIPALSQLETAMFPWASSISIQGPSLNKSKEQPFILMQTVPQSYTMNENFNLDPSQDFSLDIETKGKVVAAATQTSTGGKVALVGDSDFISDAGFQREQANAVFFVNLVDWLSSDAALSSIRARGISYRPLTVLSDSMRDTVKYGLIAVVPVLALILGFIRINKRK